MIIYCIENKINNKKYIGKTTKLVEVRYRQHCANSKSGKTYLYKAMRKYGTENFSVSVVDVAESLSDLNSMEKYYITKLRPEYNMTAGGEGGDTSKSPNFLAALSKGSSLKGKSYEDIHGKEKAKELKESRSKSNKERETASAAAVWHKKQGSTLSERHRTGRITLGLGFKRKITCSVCNMTTNPGNIARWHKHCK